MSALKFLIRQSLGKIGIEELFYLLLFVLNRAYIKHNPKRNKRTHTAPHVKKLMQIMKIILKYENR